MKRCKARKYKNIFRGCENLILPGAGGVNYLLILLSILKSAVANGEKRFSPLNRLFSGSNILKYLPIIAASSDTSRNKDDSKYASSAQGSVEAKVNSLDKK
jgi:hypothetical protein